MGVLSQRAIYYTRSANCGYSQPNRTTLQSIRGRTEGGLVAESDCSWFAIQCAQEAGYKTGTAWYTGDMRAALAAQGWRVVPWTRNVALSADCLVLSERASGGTGHVAVYIGSFPEYRSGYVTTDFGSQLLAEFWIDALGGIQGSAGGDFRSDTTGNESRTLNYFAHPLTTAGRWTHVLYPPASSTVASASVSSTNGDDFDMSAAQTVINGLRPNIDATYEHVGNTTRAVDASVKAVGVKVDALTKQVNALTDLVKTLLDKEIKTNNAVGRIEAQKSAVAVDLASAEALAAQVAGIGGEAK